MKLYHVVPSLQVVCNLDFQDVASGQDAAWGDAIYSEEPVMGRYWHDFIQLTDSMGTQHWMLVLGAVLVLGFFCMRGFGSRSNY